MTVKIDPILQARAKFAVENLTSELKAVKAALVATEDGFEVASQADANTQTSRLSAMASSFSALGTLVGDESQLGLCNNVVIDAAEGFIVIFQIRNPKQALTLCVVAGHECLMGQLLYLSKQAAQSLATA